MKIHKIPLIQDRYDEALQAVMYGMNAGGKMMFIEDEEELTRSDKQNNLLWHWNGEVAEQTNLDPKWVHGDSKLRILLPQMRVWGAKDTRRGEKMRKRAEFLHEVMSFIPDYRIKVGTAYDMVRTKSPHLTVREFGEYLSLYERDYVSKGITLTTSMDYYHEALGRAA